MKEKPGDSADYRRSKRVDERITLRGTLRLNLAVRFPQPKSAFLGTAREPQWDQESIERIVRYTGGASSSAFGRPRSDEVNNWA